MGKKFTSNELLEMVESFTDEEVSEGQDLVIKALDAEARSAIGDALDILNKFKDQYPPDVKYALDTLATLAVVEEAGAEEEEEEEEALRFTCSCTECGHVMEVTGKHCRDVTCPKCGGTMRRIERPGAGEKLIEEEEEPEEKFKDLKKRIKALEEKKGTKKSLKGQDDDEEEEEEGLKKETVPWSFSLSGEED